MAKKFHALKKIKIRASWNKINLYNLARLRVGSPVYGTYFQQKWASKSMTRAYHGEYIREGQWERMFSPQVNAVIPMDHRYLAEHDGSELAAGRGSGVDVREDDYTARKAARQNKPIPYMSMTFAPIERRLDMAIWRSLFASSAKQARQFVVHGQVKVNGQKMRFPGYLLNPGDMFQVEPDRVMFATGERKAGGQRLISKRMLKINRRKAKFVAKIEERAEAEPEEPIVYDALSEPEARKKSMADIQELIAKSEAALDPKKHHIGAKFKIQMRKLKAKTKLLRNQVGKINVKVLEDRVAGLTGTFNNLTATQQEPEATRNRKVELAPEAAETEGSPEYKRKLEKALKEIQENPIDDSKPYATPWQPRPYMSPFAFIPRYLEVNHKICSAVYLRHPVARPGNAEVPTPFGPEIQQLAFNWYLRRR
jgi:ribosomal protein S4